MAENSAPESSESVSVDPILENNGRSTGRLPGDPVGVKYCAEAMQVIGVQKESPVAWSPDGNTLAFVSGNFSLYLLSRGEDEATWEVSTVLSGHERRVKAIAFHPTNRDMIVSGGVDGLFVWSVQSASTQYRILSEPHADEEEPSHESDIECLTWLNDVVLASGSKDTNVKIWHAGQRFRLLETVYGHKSSVLSVKVHARSNRMATAGRDSTIKVWDISTLTPEWLERRMEDGGLKCGLLGNMDGHRGDVTTLAWSSSGDLLFSGARDNTWRVWNSRSFVEIRAVEDSKRGSNGKHQGDVRRIHLFQSGNAEHALTTSTDGCVCLWHMHHDPDVVGADPLQQAAEAAAEEGVAEGKEDLDAGAANAAGALGTAGVGAAGASDEGVAVPSDVASATGAADAWDADTAAILDQILHGGPSRDILLQESTGGDDLLGSFKPFGGEAIYAMEACEANGLMVMSTEGCAIHMYPLSPQPEQNLVPRMGPAGRVMELRPRLQQSFYGHEKAVFGAKLIADDTRIATCSQDNTVSLFDVWSVARLQAFHLPCAALCLSVGPVPSGAEGPQMLLVGGADYVIRAFALDPRAYDPLRRSAGGASQEIGADASVGSDGNDIPDHCYEMARYVGHAGRVRSLAVHRDGHMLVSGAQDFTIAVWDLTNPRPTVATGAREENQVPTGEPTSRTEAHAGHVLSLAFCEGSLERGNLLASAGTDHHVKLWRVDSRSMKLSLLWDGGAQSAGAHKSTVSAVAWGKDDSQNLIFSAGWDQKLKVWSATKAENTAGPEGLVGPMATFEDHAARVLDMDTCDQGNFLVCVSSDLTATLRSTVGPDFPLLARYMSASSDGALSSVSVGEGVFATCSKNGQIRVWPIYSVNDQWDAEFFAATLEETGHTSRRRRGAGAVNRKRLVATRRAEAAGAITPGQNA